MKASNSGQAVVTRVVGTISPESDAWLGREPNIGVPTEEMNGLPETRPPSRQFVAAVVAKAGLISDSA